MKKIPKKMNLKKVSGALVFALVLASVAFVVQGPSNNQPLTGDLKVALEKDGDLFGVAPDKSEGVSELDIEKIGKEDVVALETSSGLVTSGGSGSAIDISDDGVSELDVSGISTSGLSTSSELDLSGTSSSGISTSSELSPSGAPSTTGLSPAIVGTATRILGLLEADQDTFGSGDISMVVRVGDEDFDQEDIQLRVRYETDQDGACNGPWAPASISEPVSSTEVGSYLEDPVNQEENGGYQVGGINILLGLSGNQVDVSFVWNSALDLPGAFGNTSECVQITARDPLLTGETETFLVEVDNVGPQGPELYSPALNTTYTTPHTSISGYCGKDVHYDGATVQVTTIPANGFVNQYDSPILLNADGQFEIANPHWNDGEYAIHFSCTDGIGNGPVYSDPFSSVMVDTAPDFQGPTIESLNSVTQFNNGSGQIDIEFLVADKDFEEDNIQMMVEYESDHDGLCDGPWAEASLSGPIRTNEGNAILNPLSDYQISHITTLTSAAPQQSEVGFVWESLDDAPGANGSNECLQISMRDPNADGEVDTFSFPVDNMAPIGPGSLIAPILGFPSTNIDVNLVGSCGLDAANGSVRVTTFPENAFSVLYDTPIDLDYQGAFVITDPNWSEGEYDVYLNCTDELGNGPSDFGPFTPVIIDLTPPVDVDDPVCGNGVLEVGEQCDDGNGFTESCQYGLAGCTVCNSSCNYASGNASFCGDGYRQTTQGEQCDDENLINGDGCSATCRIEGSVSTSGGGGGSTVNYITNVYNPPTQPETVEVPEEGEVSSTGAVYYSAEETLERNEPCLKYNPLRNLRFIDINEREAGAIEANILKNSFLPAGSGHEQYILSGYNTQAASQGESLVGLDNPITRLEWAKTLMISHCFDIIDFSSLPEERFSGAPIPSYFDLPKNSANSWEKDIIYSATFYGILDGTLENNVELSRPVTLAEAIKMLVRTGETRQGYQTRRYDALADSKLPSNEWYFPFYSKAEYEDILTSLNAYRPGDKLFRNEGVQLLLDALLTRDTYVPEDEALVDELR